MGEAYQKRLAHLGIHTVRDLLTYFPWRYEDLSRVSGIAQLMEGERATIHGIVRGIKTRRGWGRSHFITEGVVEDESGAIAVTWFNQPYLTKTLAPGMRVALAGKVTRDKKGRLTLMSPEFELLDKNLPFGQNLKELLHTSRLVPVYAETYGLSSKWLRWKIHALLPFTLPLFEEFIPPALLAKYQFPSLRETLSHIHFPRDLKEAKHARARFAFSDLLLIRLFMLLERMKHKEHEAVAIAFDEEFVRSLVKSLGVMLTSDQRKAAWEAFKDMAKPYPMQRLLQGDVGTGKTFVALLISALVAKKGKQAVVMAPTEILATQHFATFVHHLSRFSLSIALLTRSSVKFYDPLVDHVRPLTLKKAKEKIAQGEISLVIGTHRIIASGKEGMMKFRSLVLVIIDEQHRFGVEQRALLTRTVSDNTQTDTDDKRLSAFGRRKSVALPHLLTMSATPIPRSLALTIYGSLDMSALREFPKGERKVATKIVPPRSRKAAYEFIRQKVMGGDQVYFIYPIIEESEVIDTKAALDEYENLKKNIFPEFGVGLLHGRMKGREKEEAMRNFLEGRTQILVATSVVEVGVDVANASIMVIEGAERFGLAQIHQLRGRIGRRGQAGFCFLFPHTLSGSTRERLRALQESNDGFFLAQKDMEIRGPGELLGSRQAGIPDIAMDALKDSDLIEAIKKEADILIQESQDLSRYPLLFREVNRYGKTIHLE